MHQVKKSIGIAIGCFALSLACGTAAFAQGTSGSSASDCKAPPVQQSPGAKSADQNSDITGSTTLSECGGVIKPPETGDGTLVQPAPPASNMPVVKPNDLPANQQNAK